MDSSNELIVVPEYPCLDDLMYDVFTCLLNSGTRFKASKGSGVELLGVNVRLSNPRARLSRSEMRGKVFSGLGEFFWYLSASESLAPIAHYIPNYKYSSDDGVTIHGAYGPRLFGGKGPNQFQNIIRLLSEKPGSRRAVIQLFSATDLQGEHEDVPCTCVLQAVLRDGLLNFIVYMRSNDAYWGLPHDIFAFTMLQEMLARELGVELGFYQHVAGSLHLYDDKVGPAKDYLGECYQTIAPMDRMPRLEAAKLIPLLVAEEQRIREDPTSEMNAGFDSYWEDLLRLLTVHSERVHKKLGFEDRILQIKTKMVCSAYGVYFRPVDR